MEESFTHSADVMVFNHGNISGCYLKTDWVTQREMTHNLERNFLEEALSQELTERT